MLNGLEVTENSKKRTANQTGTNVGTKTAADVNIVGNDINWDSDNDSIAIVNKPITHTFHNAATQAAAGTIFECTGQYKKARVMIDRTSITANQIDFLQSIDGTLYTPLLGVKVTADANTPPQPNIVTSINATGTDDVIYEFDIEGVKYLKMNLASITGTSVTVKAVVV